MSVVCTFSCVLCYASVSYFLDTGSLTESGARLATASDSPVFIPLSALYVGAGDLNSDLMILEQSDNSYTLSCLSRIYYVFHLYAMILSDPWREVLE